MADMHEVFSQSVFMVRRDLLSTVIESFLFCFQRVPMEQILTFLMKEFASLNGIAVLMSSLV